MHPALRQKIVEHAVAFAESLFEVFQDQPISHLTGGGGGSNTVVHAEPATRTRRAPRASKGGKRSPEQMAETIQQIVQVVRDNPNGLRSEQIQEKSGLAKREVVRPLQLALKQGFLRKEGQKRSTTYYAKGTMGKPASTPAKPARAKRKAKAAPKAARKASAKPARKPAAKPKAKARKAKAIASKKADAKHVNSAPAASDASSTTA